ncbi:MAG: hypothetical protein BWY77_01076 [bacterium ADurb.Bin431]|nr:MAG: hypothetical protein BWY77_01076 [bacterium ADurb.Bin431]
MDDDLFTRPDHLPAGTGDIGADRQGERKIHSCGQDRGGKTGPSLLVEKCTRLGEDAAGETLGLLLVPFRNPELKTLKSLRLEDVAVEIGVPGDLLPGQRRAEKIIG